MFLVSKNREGPGGTPSQGQRFTFHSSRATVTAAKYDITPARSRSLPSTSGLAVSRRTSQGVWMALAQHLNTQGLYPELYDGHAYGGSRYMPLPIVLHAALARVTGEY